MKKNLFRLFALAGLSVGLTCMSARALLITSDSFANYATGELGASGTGGTGNIPGWFNNQAPVTITNGDHSLDGTPLGLLASSGDKVSIAPTNIITTAFGCYDKFVAAKVFPQTTNVDLYYSFLYRFNVGTDVSTNGVPIIQVNRENSGFGTGVHWQLIAQRTNGAIQLGIFKNLGTVTNYSPTTVSAGQTFFVVIRQQILPGTTDDEDDLWINPAPAKFGVDETNVPPPDASTTNGTEDASTTGPGRFWIGASGASANLDELRIGTNWADVTPPVGQCIPAGVLEDPTNITQVAEIGATFSVIAIGTSPTFQWQTAPSGSSNFVNIPNALVANYTTPNLFLPGDNGNQYRVIITTPCNGLTATSAVATVSLYAPVITPPSLVMYDDFSDGIRDNTPVTTNNSVWRTATSADLNAGTPDAGLDATPADSGTGPSASLFLGYFGADYFDTPPGTNPVDLAVGTAIQVTLPFLPISNNSFTGTNSQLRFGLFDYADGGTLLTADGSAAGGSTGNGTGVRGYMLGLDYGTNFSMTTPLQWLVRNGLGDVNLMGTSGDYLSLGSGPNPSTVTTNTQAFIPGTQYQLVMTATRTASNTMSLSATVTGGVTNLTWSVTETNFAYHRFDSFGIRDNSLETTADTFDFPFFQVQVIASAIAPSAIPLTATESGNNIILTWSNPAFNLQFSTLVNTNYTTIAGATSPFTNLITGSAKFFRLTSGN